MRGWQSPVDHLPKCDRHHGVAFRIDLAQIRAASRRILTPRSPLFGPPDGLCCSQLVSYVSIRFNVRPEIRTISKLSSLLKDCFMVHSFDCG